MTFTLSYQEKKLNQTHDIKAVLLKRIYQQNRFESTSVLVSTKESISQEISKCHKSVKWTLKPVVWVSFFVMPPSDAAIWPVFIFALPHWWLVCKNDINTWNGNWTIWHFMFTEMWRISFKIRSFLKIIFNDKWIKKQKLNDSTTLGACNVIIDKSLVVSESPLFWKL